VLGGVSHLERILKDGHELLDLTIVQNPGRDSALCSKALQKIHPFSPLPILRAFDRSHVLRQRDRELVLGYKVKSTLGQAVIDLAQDLVLFLNVEVGREMRKLPLLHSDDVRRRSRKELVGAIEFVAVGWLALRSILAIFSFAVAAARLRFILERIVGKIWRRQNVIHRVGRRVSAWHVPALRSSILVGTIVVGRGWAREDAGWWARVEGGGICKGGICERDVATNRRHSPRLVRGNWKVRGRAKIFVSPMTSRRQGDGRFTSRQCKTRSHSYC
jgi:hypothetical protein